VPLFADGIRKIRKSLELVAAGKKSPYVKIGAFTPDQLGSINAMRKEDEMEPIEAIIVCDGKHLYKSRCVKDGYSIDDVVEEIALAFELAIEAARGGWSTVLRNPGTRIGKEGHIIKDELVFECHQKHPNAALFSVIPRGDGRGPEQKKRPLEEGPFLKS
jgi:hypothetical protein